MSDARQSPPPKFQRPTVPRASRCTRARPTPTPLASISLLSASAVSLSPKSHSTPARSACASRRDQCASHRNGRPRQTATVVKTPRPYRVAAVTACRRADVAFNRRWLSMTCGCIGSCPRRSRSERGGQHTRSAQAFANFLRRAVPLYPLRPKSMTTPASDSEKLKPRLRVRVAVVASSLTVALLIFEVFLRAIGFTYPVFYQPDEARGYALRPGMEGWYRKEGEAFVRINGDGLRDREHSKQKPPDTLRVAVVGDSYAEAFQVDEEKAFWSVMGRRLQDCPAMAGRRVEVINFGVSGYGTAQELLTLREKVWDYSPDIVLLAVTTNNDVLDNSRALKQTDEIPYFTLDGDQLVPDNSFRDAASFRLRDSALNRTGRWLRDHLRFVQAIHLAHAAFKSKLAEWRELRAAAKKIEHAGDAPSVNGSNTNAAGNIPSGGDASAP